MARGSLRSFGSHSLVIPSVPVSYGHIFFDHERIPGLTDRNTMQVDCYEAVVHDAIFTSWAMRVFHPEMTKPATCHRQVARHLHLHKQHLIPDGPPSGLVPYQIRTNKLDTELSRSDRSRTK